MSAEEETAQECERSAIVTDVRHSDRSRMRVEQHGLSAGSSLYSACIEGEMPARPYSD